MKDARWLLFGWIAAAAVVGGCGGPEAPPVPTEEATVRGTVAIRGKPIRDGEVIFTAVVPGAAAPIEPRMAKLGSDGSYTLRALVGENSVKVRGPAVAKDAAFAENETVVNVAPGENTVPITMP